MKTILSEYKIHNADITLRRDCTSDDFIDIVGEIVFMYQPYVLKDNLGDSVGPPYFDYMNLQRLKMHVPASSNNHFL